MTSPSAASVVDLPAPADLADENEPAREILELSTEAVMLLEKSGTLAAARDIAGGGRGPVSRWPKVWCGSGLSFHSIEDCDEVFLPDKGVRVAAQSGSTNGGCFDPPSIHNSGSILRTSPSMRMQGRRALHQEQSLAPNRDGPRRASGRMAKWERYSLLRIRRLPRSRW